MIGRTIYGNLPAPVARLARWIKGLLHLSANSLRRLGTCLRVRSAMGHVTSPITIVRDANCTWLSHPVVTFNSRKVMAEHLAMVVDVFSAEEIEHVVLPFETNMRCIVAVSEKDTSRVHKALCMHLGPMGVYGAPIRGTRVKTARLLGRRSPEFKEKCIRIFRALSSESGLLLSTHQVGCDVQFWAELPAGTERGPAGERVPPGTWAAPVANRWAAFLQPENRTPAPVVSQEVGPPTLAATSLPHMLTTTRPIDAVYTWVDGSDPDWLCRRTGRLNSLRHEFINQHSVSDSRFTSRDELKHSLRSLEMFGGWVRHVYVVTDDQVPAWLDIGHSDLTIVSHRDIFDNKEHLPTFNSHAIETQLHHIDGLSENFLYFNDDVFIGRPITPEQFVLSNGMSVFFLSGEKVDLSSVQPNDFPAMAAGKNNRGLISNTFGHQITNKIRHVPHSLRRSVLEDLELTYPDQIRRTSASPFRSPTDISVASSLAHYFAYFTGRAIPGNIRSAYFDISRTDTRRRLDRLLEYRNLDVFCLNEHDSSGADPETQDQFVHSFLANYYPTPSRFELPSGAAGHTSSMAHGRDVDT